MVAMRRLVIIGIDSLIPTILERLVEMGRLPTFERLMREGSYSRALPCWPAETGCNWATIATGATPARHGCKYSVHLPGWPLDKAVPGFSSELCRAEQIWQVVDRLGGLSIVIDYPQSYPINAKRVVHVGEDGYPGPNSRLCIANAHAYVTRDPPTELPEYLRRYLTKVEVRRAEGWANLPEGGQLEVELPVETRGGVVTFYALLEREGEAYRRVSLFAERDYSKKLGEARAGGWSNWVRWRFRLGGEMVWAYFRYKVIELSEDGRSLHVYMSQVYPEGGWTHPPELAKELVDRFGPYLHRPTEQALVVSGASDVETFIEEQEYQAEWYSKAASHLLRKYDWSLFIMKWHGPDFFEHFSLHMIDPSHPLFDPEREAEGWELYARFYGICDRLVSSVLSAAGDDAVVAVVGDHGHVANVVHHVGNEVLEEAGLLARRPDGSVDWSRTKAAFLAEGVWVNLKGRDPHGVVEPGEEYERVRDEVIALLLSLKDPETGRPVFSMVCRREEAKVLGVGGDRDPDVVFCYSTWAQPKARVKRPSEHPLWGVVTGTHGAYLPSAKTAVGTIETVFIVRGPGVKRGYRRPRPVALSDVAPTLCYVAGIPAPRDAEGRVIRDMLEGEPDLEA